MSQQLINRSPDLKRLRNEGYDLEIRGAYVLVKDVPYVNSRREIKRGILLSDLNLAGDKTVRPQDHVALFMGEYPCNADGTDIAQIRHWSGERPIEGLVVTHSFSAKPKPSDFYPDYYAKMTAYVTILSGPAQVLDSTVTAKTFPVIQPDEGEKDSPFNYIDTATSRADIDAATEKLKRLNKIAIIGLGGTGSYVLDLVAKTPVREIHLYDGDSYLQHNAFRSPGAPSREDLDAQFPKVTWFKNVYSKMHSGIVEHPFHVDASNVEDLREMEFVFLCMDSGESKRPIIEKLEQFDVPFVDVGIGVQVTNGSLCGIVRLATSTPQKRDHFRGRVSLADGVENNEYNRNIQVADLNALNAALAVIKWKRLVGFYHALKAEHYTQFHIDTNLLLNEDFA